MLDNPMGMKREHEPKREVYRGFIGICPLGSRWGLGFRVPRLGFRR